MPAAIASSKKIAIAAARISSFLSKRANDIVTKLQARMPCNFVTGYDSPRPARHPQLRKEKRVNVGQLLDALAQCGAYAVARAGAGSQENRIRGFVGDKQTRCHLSRMIRRDASVVCAGHQ